MCRYAFHIVNFSSWPIFMGFLVFFFALNLLFFRHGVTFTGFGLFLSFLLLFLILFLWFFDIDGIYFLFLEGDFIPLVVSLIYIIFRIWLCLPL